MGLYKHKFYDKQSECVKYRGTTNQVDIVDSIIAVLAKYPGLTGEEVAAKIFPPELGWSRKRVLERLKQMSTPIEIDENASEDEEVEVPILVTDGELYFLFYDAWAHDIGKTKAVMDKLNELGVSAETANFLSQGITMYAEELKEGKHKEDLIVAEPLDIDGKPLFTDVEDKATLRQKAIDDLKAEREAKEEAAKAARIKELEAKVLAEKQAKAEAELKARKEAYDKLPWWKKLFTTNPN